METGDACASSEQIVLLNIYLVFLSFSADVSWKWWICCDSRYHLSYQGVSYLFFRVRPTQFLKHMSHVCVCVA